MTQRTRKSMFFDNFSSFYPQDNICYAHFPSYPIIFRDLKINTVTVCQRHVESDRVFYFLNLDLKMVLRRAILRKMGVQNYHMRIDIVIQGQN